MRKRIYTLLAAVIILISAVSALPASAANEYGMTFSAGDNYVLSGSVPFPVTIEATIELPADFEGRAGVIVGNYDAQKSACFNLEINKNGNPRLYVIDNEQKVYDINFNKIDVREGKPVHIAVTYNKDTHTAVAYKNGVRAQSASLSLPETITLKSVPKLGGDYRTGNTQNFKGKIYGLAFWSDVRTDTEIKTDMDGIEADAESLISAWDMSEIKTGELVSSISGIGAQKRNITYKEEDGWTRDGAYKGSYAYSFAVIGDTQRVTRRDPDKLTLIYDWIIENAEEKNTKFVIGLGDITDTDSDKEWATAKAAITKLDGVVPYSLVRGNHDSIAKYKSTFPISEYNSKISASYNGNMLDTYHLFEVGSVKYMILCLDLKFSEEQIEWANKVIEDHPDRNVIVTTHIYLTADGNASGADTTKYGASFDAYQLWDRLLRKHRNIVMLICGHSPCDTVLVTSQKGDNGNIVREVLIDPQGIDDEEGSTGLVATFYFSEDGRKVNVDYYSTIKQKYRANSKCSFILDLLEVEEPETTAPETTELPDTAVSAEPGEGGCASALGGISVFAVSALAVGAALTSVRRKKK